MEIEEIQRILASGEFDQFLRAEENAVLEVKSECYDLLNDAVDRYELAKDVSSLANAGGGYLLIGLHTQRVLQTQVDTVDQLTLIPEVAFDTGRYEGIIGTHIFPPIEGLTVRWSVCRGSADGLGIIEVPAQSEDLKPFVILRVIDDRTHLKEIVVGFAQRNSVGGTDVLTPKRVQDFLRKGRDGTSQRLTRIEELLEQISRTGVPQERIVPPGDTLAPPRFDVALIDARIEGTLRDFEA